MTYADERAAAIARRYALYAACIGLIPIPLLDLAAIAAIQATMLAEIGALYGVPFVGLVLGVVCAPGVAFLVTRGLARAFVGWRNP